jgi:hypothetical protein
MTWHFIGYLVDFTQSKGLTEIKRFLSFCPLTLLYFWFNLVEIKNSNRKPPLMILQKRINNNSDSGAKEGFQNLFLNFRSS